MMIRVVRFLNKPRLGLFDVAYAIFAASFVLEGRFLAGAAVMGAGLAATFCAERAIKEGEL